MSKLLFLSSLDLYNFNSYKSFEGVKVYDFEFVQLCFDSTRRHEGIGNYETEGLSISCCS